VKINSLLALIYQCYDCAFIYTHFIIIFAQVIDLANFTIFLCGDCHKG